MKLPKPIKCVIFDMDGVIIDSEEIHKKAYYETFVSIGVDVSNDLYKTLTGSSTINAFQKLVAHFNLDLDPEELVLDKRKRYVNFFENDPNLHLVKGIEEIIKFLYDKDVTLILASSSAITWNKPFKAILVVYAEMSVSTCSKVKPAADAAKLTIGSLEYVLYWVVTVFQATSAPTEDIAVCTSG